MRTNYFRAFFVIFGFLFLCIFTEQGYAYSDDCLKKPTQAEQVECLKKEKAEADNEEIRLLQEEVRLKQESNARIRQRMKEQSSKSTDSSQLNNSGSQTVANQSESRTQETQNSDSSNSNNTNTVDTRRLTPPLTNNGDTRVTEPDNDDPTASNQSEEPKCRDFPVDLPAGATEEQKKQFAEKVNEFSIFRQQLCRLIDESKPIFDDSGQVIESAKIRFRRSSEELVRLIVAKTITDTDNPKLLTARKFLLKAEKVRTDKQIGSDSKSNGTTSIVSKGGIPALFAFAVENGAATSSVDGTTMTFRVNPAGLLQVATGSDYAQLFEERQKKPFLDILGKTSLGFSFDAKRGFETPTFTGSERQLSAFSFRYEFINERSPKHSKFVEKWQNFVKNPAQDFFEKQSVAFEEIFLSEVRGERGFKTTELRNWTTNADAKLVNNSDTIANLITQGKDKEAVDLMEEIFLAELDKLPVSEIRASPTFSAFIASVDADKAYIEARNDLFDEIAKGQVATFEYINFREPIKPDMHSLRFIWEKGIYKGIDFTVNASLTFYNRKPTNPEVRRIRDFDVSGQFDIPLRRADFGVLSDSVISFAGKYQRLNTDVVDDLGLIVPGTKGDIGVGQVKWTIPIGETGLKLPISFTFANRTELIKEKEVRGNFGLTIDFDSILAGLKSFSPAFLR